MRQLKATQQEKKQANMDLQTAMQQGMDKQAISGRWVNGLRVCVCGGSASLLAGGRAGRRRDTRSDCVGKPHTCAALKAHDSEELGRRGAAHTHSPHVSLLITHRLPHARSIKDMLYKKRMERELMRAKGLLKEAEKPPGEEVGCGCMVKEEGGAGAAVAVPRC